MNFRIGNRTRNEKNRIENREDLAALHGATDREIEQIIRNVHKNREARWDVIPSQYGIRM
jgi:hypothetical protein